MLEFHKNTCADVDFLLKKCHCYSSLVNSSSMQHNTRAYQSQVLCKYKIERNALFFSLVVLELSKLEFLVIWNSSLLSLSSLYLFFNNQQINIKISNFFHLNTQTYVFIYLNRSIVKYRNFNFKILILRPLKKCYERLFVKWLL